MDLDVIESPSDFVTVILGDFSSDINVSPNSVAFGLLMGITDQNSSVLWNVVWFGKVGPSSVNNHHVSAKISTSQAFKLDHLVNDLASGISNANQSKLHVSTPPMAVGTLF